MKYLHLVGCAGLAFLGCSAALSQKSNVASSGYCPNLTAEPGWIVTRITPASKGTWQVGVERIGPAGSAGVRTIDRNTRSTTGISSIQWYPCNVVHPPQSDFKKDAKVIGGIFSIPGIVPRGRPRTDTGSIDNSSREIKEGEQAIATQGAPKTDFGSPSTSSSETVYDRIEQINKEDEERQRANALREAAIPLKGYLGASTQTMSPGLAKAYKMDQTVGEWITDLQADGPAVKAGLLPEDVIYTVNNKKIDGSAGVRLVDVISSIAPGTVVKIVVFRRNIGPLSYDVVLEGRR